MRRLFLIAVCALVGLSVRPAVAQTEPSYAAREVERLLASEVFTGPTFSAAKVAPPVSDETYLRRVFLDLNGVIPSPEQVTAFCLDPAPDKRAKIVEQLLTESEYGMTWARYWRDVIIVRRTEERALLAVPSLHTFLAQRFNEDAGWDKIARDFITATGDVREEGATALIFAQSSNADDVAAEVSRLFLGVQIQCAQCHDHPTDRWKREQFHELAAFFPRVATRPVRTGEQRSFAVVSTDGGRLIRKAVGAKEIEHYMPDLDDPSAKGTLMTPVFFVSGQKLTVGTRDLDRRSTFVDWLTNEKNPWFAAAYVNRIWSELVGEGFYEPVDDLGPDRACSAPKTLAYLAEEFRANNFSTKWLLKTITATQAYAREARPPRTSEELPFLANRAQPLRAETLYDCLGAALDVDVSEGASEQAAKLRGKFLSPRAEFISTFGYDPSLSRDEVASSIPQALLLMNGRSIERANRSNAPNSMIARLVSRYSKDTDAVFELYLRVFARQPRPNEIQTALAHVRAVPNRGEAYEDLLWALLNSSEFRYRN